MNQRFVTDAGSRIVPENVEVLRCFNGSFLGRRKLDTGSNFKHDDLYEMSTEEDCVSL